jgi:hypothetical protein
MTALHNSEHDREILSTVGYLGRKWGWQNESFFAAATNAPALRRGTRALLRLLMPWAPSPRYQILPKGFSCKIIASQRAEKK